MSKHHEDHPEYAELGIFAGYMEYYEKQEAEGVELMDKPFELPTRDHVGEELSEISQAYLDKKITARECTDAWVLALERSTIFGSTGIPEDQVKDLAEVFIKYRKG